MIGQKSIADMMWDALREVHAAKMALQCATAEEVARLKAVGILTSAADALRQVEATIAAIKPDLHGPDGK